MGIFIFTMNTCLISLLLLGIFQAALAGKCQQFSVGECGLENDNIVEIKNVSCDGGDPDACFVICQRFCHASSPCNFFTYNVDREECVLMKEPSENAYVSSCDVVAGPASPTLKYCLENTPFESCDRFIAEDCVYEGNVVFNMTNVESPNTCQELLADLGDFYKAEFFIHDIDPPTQLCQLLDTGSERRTCSLVAGPKEPPYPDCIP